MKLTWVRFFLLVGGIFVGTPSFLVGAGYFSSSYECPGQWTSGTPKQLAELLADENYSQLMPYAYYYTEIDQQSDMVGFILQGASSHKHVPMMYMVVRGYVQRLKKGNMLSTDELNTMFIYIILSLLRVQEDYAAVSLVLEPHEKAAKVYRLLKWKYWYWLRPYIDRIKSASCKYVFEQVAAIAKEKVDYDHLPNPAWILMCCFSGQTTINFDSPSHNAKNIFKTYAGLVKEARLKRQAMVLDYAVPSSWQEFFKNVQQDSWSEWAKSFF
ncbi:hypothetical protein IPF37_01265 [bacterium]|nr:MAG: hypothetical protein IPF37_01265 [bacterium]